MVSILYTSIRFLYLARPALSELLPRVSAVPRQAHAAHVEGSKMLY